MSYKIPFYYAMKYLLLCNALEVGKFFIRMKVFLLLCVTYFVNVVNYSPPTWNRSPIEVACSNWFWSDDHNLIFPRNNYIFVMNTLAGLAVVAILLFNEAQSEFAGEITFVIILSYWTNIFPLHFIYKLGSRAGNYCDLLATILCDQIQSMVEKKDDHRKSGNLVGSSVSSGLDYVVFAGVLLAQGSLAEWMCELLFENSTRSEEIMLQVFISLPTFIGLLVRKYSVNEPWYIEWLPELGVIAPIISAFVNLAFIPREVCPFHFHVPAERFTKLLHKLGLQFFLKFYLLQAKLTLKFYMLTYETMICLKLYFIARVLQNIGKMPEKLYTFTGFTDTIIMSFHQDFLTVLGSSSLIGRLTRYVGTSVFSPDELDADEDILPSVEHIPISMLGFIPTAYIVLGFANVYSECDHEKRLANLFTIGWFFLLIFVQYVCTFAWEKTVVAVAYMSEENKPSDFVKIFVGIALILYLLVTLRCKSCEDEEYDDRPDNTDFLDYFAYHILVSCVVSSVLIYTIIAYYMLKYGYEEIYDVIESYEDKFYFALATVTLVEFFSAFIIFEKALTICLCRHSNKSLVTWMGAVHVYFVFIEKGYLLNYRLIMSWRTLRAISNDLDYLDDNVVKSCSICEDEIENGDGRVSKICGHAFHDFCLRLWVSEHGSKCADCGTELNPTKRQTRSGRQYDAQTEQIATLLETVLEQFHAFDEGNTFFNEKTDIEMVDSEDEVDEEEEEIYYVDANGLPAVPAAL